MTQPTIHCDPEIQGGVPVFYGTRVPVRICSTTSKPATLLISFCIHTPRLQECRQ